MPTQRGISRNQKPTRRCAGIHSPSAWRDQRDARLIWLGEDRSTPTLAFGDNVRIRDTPETTERALAGRTGQIHGVTRPSVTGVSVIGPLRSDCDFNVSLESPAGEHGFAEELLEFIDHAPGTEIELGDVKLTPHTNTVPGSDCGKRTRGPIGAESMRQLDLSTRGSP